MTAVRGEILHHVVRKCLFRSMTVIVIINVGERVLSELGLAASVDCW